MVLAVRGVKVLKEAGEKILVRRERSGAREDSISVGWATVYARTTMATEANKMPKIDLLVTVGWGDLAMVPW